MRYLTFLLTTLLLTSTANATTLCQPPLSTSRAEVLENVAKECKEGDDIYVRYFDDGSGAFASVAAQICNLEFQVFFQRVGSSGGSLACRYVKKQRRD
jgi:hypothetical protein